MRRPVQEPAVHLKWQHMIWEWERPILIRQVLRSVKRESIEDTARVLGRMFDGIEYRGYGQEIVEDLAKYAGVPVGMVDQRVPSDADACRYADYPREFRRTERTEAGLYG